MADENFLQLPIFTVYIFPFFLMFFIVFAILERTKLFGEAKKQLNALVAFVIALIFVGSGASKLIVGNMVLFFAVAVVILFVIILLWGFIFGDEKGFKVEPWMKWVLGILVGIAFIGAILWATGWSSIVGNFFSGQSQVWTNIAFIVAIAIALALVLIGKEKKP